MMKIIINFTGMDQDSQQLIKVCIVDDDDSYREILENILASDPRMKLYNIYASGKQFIQDLNSPFLPDVCIIDFVLKDMSGIECGKRVKEVDPNIHVIIMTAYPDTNSFAEANKIGADFVEKGPRIEFLLDQLITSKSFKNERVISLQKNSTLNTKHIDFLTQLEAIQKRSSELSKMQYEVLTLKKQGKSNDEIASILCIDKGTVRTHIKRAMKKLNLPDILDFILE